MSSFIDFKRGHCNEITKEFAKITGATKREQQVAVRLAINPYSTDKQIADSLGIALSTLKKFKQTLGLKIDGAVSWLDGANTTEQCRFLVDDIAFKLSKHINNE